MNEIQLQILEAMYESDSEYVVGYDTFENVTGRKRKVLKPEVTALRKACLIEHVKGCMNDDNEVTGSGFAIVYGMREKVEALLSPHLPVNEKKG